MTDTRHDWIIARLTDEQTEVPLVLDRIPEARWLQTPPGDLSEWSVHRHLFHLTHFETASAPSVLRHLRDGLPVDPRYLGTPEQRAEVIAWETAPDGPELVEHWQAARQATIDFVRALRPEEWEQAVPHPAFGPASLDWYLLKIHQHTLAHLNTLLRITLWWDFLLRPKLDYDAL